MIFSARRRKALGAAVRSKAVLKNKARQKVLALDSLNLLHNHTLLSTSTGKYNGKVLKMQTLDNLSHIVRKPEFCRCENKGADQLRSNCEADHAFVFGTQIVQFLFYLSPKFQASSLLL